MKIKFRPAGDFHHYLPIPDSLLHGGFYITSAGFSRVGRGDAYPKALHPSLYHFKWTQGRILPEFSVMLITKGAGLFESQETGRVPLREGSVVLLFPGVWHRYRPNQRTGWTEKWAHFNGEFAHQLLELGVLSSDRPVLQPSDTTAVEDALDRLLESTARNPSSNSLFHSLQVLGALAAAVGEPQYAAVGTNPEPFGALVTAAIAHIWTRSHHVLSVSDVANALGVTRRTLERHVAAALGHTVLDEIIQCRFGRAERLLRETDLPVKSVVNLSGFGSMENMRQVFIARTNLAPSAYRSQRHAGNAVLIARKGHAKFSSGPQRM